MAESSKLSISYIEPHFAILVSADTYWKFQRSKGKVGEGQKILFYPNANPFSRLEFLI
jgi:hypothetical protein